MEFSVSEMMLENQRLFASIVRDITNRKEAEIALQASEAKARKILLEMEKKVWISTGQTGLNDIMRGQQKEEVLANNLIAYVCKYIKALVGALYLNQDGGLYLKGSYAYTQYKGLPDYFKLGEGLIGQAALEQEQVVINPVPDDYIKISSGLGLTTPRYILIFAFYIRPTSRWCS